MKKIILLLSITLLSTLSFGQAWEGRGDFKIESGIEFYGYGTGLVTNIDFGILEDVSTGVGINYNFDFNNLYINLRGDYHFQRLFRFPREFDMYAGIDVGFNTNYTSNIGFGAHIGGRYMFTDAVGAYLEIGNRGSIGIVFNLF